MKTVKIARNSGHMKNDRTPIQPDTTQPAARKNFLPGSYFIFSSLLVLCALIYCGFSYSSDSGSDDLDRFIETRMAEAAKPGLSAAVVKDGRVVFSRAYGFADIEQRVAMTVKTPLIIGSVSKTIVAVAAMKLVEQGRLSLDADCSQYLPFTVRNPKYPDIPISVRMLFTHTSSIKSNWGQVMMRLLKKGDSEESIASFCEGYLSPGGKYYHTGNFAPFAPGTEFEYSNTGVTLLAFIVEKISGLDFESYCRNNIFIPLEMENTSWYYKNLSQKPALPYEKTMGLFYRNLGLYSAPYYPAGFLKSTASDYASFMIMIMNGGSYNGKELLSAESVQSLLAVQQGVTPDHWDKIGLIFQHKMIDGKMYTGHTGGLWGVSGLAHFDPQTKTGVVMFMNGGWKSFFQFDRLKERPVREIYLRLFSIKESEYQ